LKKLTSTPTLADIQQAHLEIQPYINNFIIDERGNAKWNCDALFWQSCSSPGYIVMPENSPIIKKNAVIGYGAEVTLCESTQAARESTLEGIVEKTGAAFIHPYDNFNVICGQATASKELYEEVGELDIILSPVGGGGLMSGTALTTHYLFPKTKIIGTDPQEVNDAARSFQTIADGLRTNLSSKTFDIIQQHVHDIITVEESEIIEAMRLIWERMKIIIEPSSAVPFAAVLKRKEFFNGKKIGILISGGNVDVGNLPF